VENLAKITYVRNERSIPKAREDIAIQAIILPEKNVIETSRRPVDR
jgi:hypothetical protein